MSETANTTTLLKPELKETYSDKKPKFSKIKELLKKKKKKQK